VGKTISDVMAFEYMKPSAPSKKTIKKGINKMNENNINNIPSTSIVWYLVKKHKFGLLATFTVIYVTMSLFGTLIIGLLQGIFY